MTTVTGNVVGLAYRPHEGDDMRPADSFEVLAGSGPTGEERPASDRQITLLSMQSWQDACRELDAEVPWLFRRANVLIDGFDLAGAIGKRIRVGEIRIEVLAESRPCGLMDRQHAGLKAALVPECRGGVYGRVIQGGQMSIGDEVSLIEQS